MIKGADIVYAKKLKELRKSSGKIQYNLGLELGLKNQQAYSDLENGKIQFDEKLVYGICKIFKISYNDFVSLPITSGNSQSEASKSLEEKIEARIWEKLLIEKDIKINDLEIKNYSLKSKIDYCVSVIKYLDTKLKEKEKIE